MNPRRPPEYPLCRGLFWKHAHAGGFRANDPLAEWAYRTPAHPQGLSRSALRRATQAAQTELAEYWYRLNFLPFEHDVGGTGYGVLPAGPGGYAPGSMLPGAYLTDEFTDVLPLTVIEDISARLMREATWWIPVPPESSPPDSSEPADAARVALERVAADLERVGPGHNQGPPLDPAIVAEIREQVRVGLEAVVAGSAGKDGGKSAASGLLTLAGTIGSAFAQGVAKKAGENAEPFVKHGLAVLLDHMLQAASALLHWIASINPGPLL